MANTPTSEELKSSVREQYAKVATHTATTATSEQLNSVAMAFGYSAEELKAVPEGSNLGVSCGNPTAVAHLKPGEVVVDLGSGGGIDCFLAAAKVGSSGKVIGIDMTPAMVELARENAKKRGESTANVEFRLGDIENLPVESGTVDVVISNCVINLVPDKKKAFAEINRILKKGGRLAISDVALKQSLPECVKSKVSAHTACIAGAMLIDDYINNLKLGGFQNVAVVDSGADLNIWKSYLSSEGKGSAFGCCSGNKPSTESAPTSSSCGCTSSPSSSSATTKQCCSQETASSSAASTTCCSGTKVASTTTTCCSASSPSASCCGGATSTPTALTCCSSGTNVASTTTTTSCCGGAPSTPAASQCDLAAILKNIDINNFIASVKVYAVK